MAAKRGQLKKRWEGRNLRRSSKVLNKSAPLKFLCLLYRFALLHLGCCGLSRCWSLGALGVHEELWREWAGGVEHANWNLWLVYTDVVFEHITFVAIGKDQLQGLLVVLLHGFFVFAGLRLERRCFIFGCPNL